MTNMRCLFFIAFVAACGPGVATPSLRCKLSIQLDAQQINWDTNQSDCLKVESSDFIQVSAQKDTLEIIGAMALPSGGPIDSTVDADSDAEFRINHRSVCTRWTGNLDRNGDSMSFTSSCDDGSHVMKGTIWF